MAGIKMWVAVVVGISAPVLAADANCTNRAARSQKDCKQACAQIKDTPAMAEKMKAGRIKDCDTMCAMVEDSARQACEKKQQRRK